MLRDTFAVRALGWRNLNNQLSQKAAPRWRRPCPKPRGRRLWT